MANDVSERRRTVLYGVDKEKYKKRLGKLIRRKRRSLSLSQEDVAELVLDDPKNRTRISEWERGVHEPVHSFERLIEVLAISDDELDFAKYGVVNAADQWHQISGAFLPAPPETYVGQAEGIDILRQFLMGGKKSILIHGMGGMGKTALVAKVLANHGPSNASSVFFLNVNSFENNVGSETSTRTALTRLIYQYGDHQKGLPAEIVNLTILWKQISRSVDTLIIFDNVEDQKQMDALKPIGNSRWIATSRRVFPGASIMFEIAPLSFEEAAQLAQAVSSDNGKSLDQKLALRLGELSDRLPLAIEVAASAIALTPGIDIQSFFISLENTHKTFPLVEDWENRVISRLKVSIDQLPEEIKIHWSYLGLFSGGFFSEAAQAIIGEFKIDTLLSKCLRRHLIMTGSKLGRTKQHYFLHDFLKAIALRELNSLPLDQLKQIKKQFSDYYVRWIESSISDKVAFDTSSKVPIIVYEIDNLRSAFEFSIDDTDIASVERFAVLVTDKLLEQQYPLNERLDWITKAQEKLVGKNNVLGNERYAEVLGRLAIAKAVHLNDLGRATDAENEIAAALQDERLTRFGFNRARFQAHLGQILRQLPERYEEALNAFRRAVKEHLDTKLPNSIYSEMQLLYGDFLLHFGQPTKAEEAYQEALEVAELNTENYVEIANACCKLAELYLRNGQFDLSKEFAAKAERIVRMTGLNHTRIRALNALGMSNLQQDQQEECNENLDDALQLSRKHHLKVWETISLSHMAEAELKTSNYNQARILAKSAIKNAVEFDHVSNAGGAFRAIALAYQGLGKLKMAQRAIAKSLTIHFDNNMRMSVIDDYEVFAEICAAAGNKAMALKFARLATLSNVAAFQGSNNVASRIGSIVNSIDE